MNRETFNEITNFYYNIVTGMEKGRIAYRIKQSDSGNGPDKIIISCMTQQLEFNDLMVLTEFSLFYKTSHHPEHYNDRNIFSIIRTNANKHLHHDGFEFFQNEADPKSKYIFDYLTRRAAEELTVTTKKDSPFPIKTIRIDILGNEGILTIAEKITEAFSEEMKNKKFKHNLYTLIENFYDSSNNYNPVQTILHTITNVLQSEHYLNTSIEHIKHTGSEMSTIVAFAIKK